MLYNLIQMKNGKELVIMTDSMKKINNRIRILKVSHRKTSNVCYKVELSDINEKFKKRPHDPKVGGGDATTPRLVKWN